MMPNQPAPGRRKISQETIQTVESESRTAAANVLAWIRLVEAFEQSGDLHLTHPREYSSWRHAKARVRNPNDVRFGSHGRRGITMALAWRNSFAQFLKDMGRRPPGTTLERKDNNGPYSPGNCIWATVAKQNANRRGWAKPKA